MGNVTRAVIELSEDISPAMPLMKEKIDGCGYNPEVPVAAFRYENLGVIDEKNRIIINNAVDETAAQMVIGLLKDIIRNADEKTAKMEVN